jgi:small subunit ribosomal protein S17
MECSDKNCPKHGEISVRGRTFKGKIVKFRADKTAVVEWPRIIDVPKYDRAYKSSSKVTVHVPACLKVHEGDTVEIGETRKLSRTKSFVITEVLSSGKEA